MDDPVDRSERSARWRGRSTLIGVSITPPPAGGLAPTDVAVRARPRFVILWIVAAAFCLVMAWAANGPPPEGDVGSARALAAIAAFCLLAAWRCADLRVRATSRGILVVNLLTWRRVGWEQLLGVVSEEVRAGTEQTREFDRMVLQTVHGRVRVRAVIGDASDPDGLYARVGEALLAMGDRYGPPRARRTQSRLE